MRFILLFCLLTLSLSSFSDIYQKIQLSKFKKSFKTLLKSTLKSHNLSPTSLLHLKNTLNTLKTYNISQEKSFTDESKTCKFCLRFIYLFRGLDNPAVVSALLDLGKKLCELFLDKSVCEGTMKIYGKTFLDNFIKAEINPNYMCGRMNLCKKTYNKYLFSNYLRDILSDKPPRQRKNATKRETFKILHIADTHMDLQYLPGSNKDCSEPFCCRAKDGMAKNKSSAAGKWGALAPCDPPYETIEEAIKYAGEVLKPDVVVWTGDSADHDIWNQVQSNQTKPTHLITNLLKKYVKNASIYPIFGNHECFPTDQFDVFGNSSFWLQNETSEMWKDHLGALPAQSLRQHGYYYFYNEKYNIKFIALNTQTCDVMNFWRMRDPTDPNDELLWLRMELYLAEINNQDVIIFGHIPTGDLWCAAEWGRRFLALVDRFENIIRGQFFGHTHDDQIETLVSLASGVPVGTNFIAPSLTTFSYLNPSLRVFEVDRDTNVLINYYQYRLDLEKANQQETGPLPWNLAYNFLEEYNLPDMSPESINKFSKDLDNNKTLLKKYIFNFNAGGPLGNFTDKEVGEKKKTKYYTCLAQHAVFTDAMKCMGVYNVFNPIDFVYLLLNDISGTWFEVLRENQM